MGMLDLLRETPLSEEQLDYANTARACAETLLDILNTTLEYSALEAGHLKLDNSEFRLADVLESAVEQNLHRAEAKGLFLTLALGSTLPETITGDAARLRQVAAHVIANAVKFTHTGTIEVTAQRDGSWLLLGVKDTGIGIAPGQLGEIFESFQQGDRGLSRGYSGVGLGLALTRGIIHKMGGGITVESSIGQGSNFTVRLPLGQRHSDGEAVATGGQDGPLILAVEDNPVGLKVLRRALERRGLRADYATNGIQAVEAASRRLYDLVLMDLEMPEMDGLTAAQELRKIPGYREVPILALTANTSDQVRELCRQNGLQAFLTKPIESNELWNAVHRYLHR